VPFIASLRNFAAATSRHSSSPSGFLDPPVDGSIPSALKSCMKRGVQDAIMSAVELVREECR